MEQITIVINSLKAVNGDVNKKIASELKKLNKSVQESDVIVLSKEEPGRCWVKKAGRANCVAYG